MISAIIDFFKNLFKEDEAMEEFCQAMAQWDFEKMESIMKK